jgi:ATP-dependent DNA helicase RecG
MARRLGALAEIPVTRLNGVGPRKAEALEQVGILTVLDLLQHYPRRYLDRTAQVEISQLRVNEEALVLARVKRVQSRRTRAGRALVEVDIGDGSGFLRCSFFNQAWRAKQLKEGTEAAFFGKLDIYKGRRQMTNPVVDLVGDRTGRIVPLYPQSEKAGLTTWELGDWVAEALGRAGDLVDPLPDRWRDELDVVDRTWAMRQIHAPESMGAAMAARKRLALDELLRLQMILVMRKRAIERESKGIRHKVEGELLARFEASLPFPLTKAQERAIAAIAVDLAGPHPMHRLLQGDVGAGKTLVAVSSMLMAVQGGYQAALMAPTEVLAEQHALGVRDLLKGLKVPAEEGSLFAERELRVELLTNRTTPSQRTKLATALADGAVDILIGTHALLTEGVAFRSLGVVVIDEQHRFGVEQRAALRGKGDDPDVLVMTATPIPRTAAMTVYGDLDVTVLDELPPGRTPIRTAWARGELEEAAAWQRVRAEVEAGRQAYVVCPLVEESERVQARSATEEFERLQAEELRGLRVGLLHGQMPAAKKEEAMELFRRRDIDVLVATTVIEVGVDVPNATVMVIEDADRFGIAQLHQLRGRVGRGGAESWCYLLGGGNTPDSEERLTALVESTDGFHLAEVDLELRGEGTILGTRQKGKSDLKLASLRRDKELVKTARDVAFDIVDSDPLLERHADLNDEVRWLVDPEEAEFLFKS